MPVAHRASATFNATIATTSGTITIPASVLTNDVLYVMVVSRDHTSGTALPTCTDNDSGGNTWTLLGNTSDRKLLLWWKRATSATAGKTITVAGCVGSCTGGVSAFSGAIISGTPSTNLTFEDNISGNETHAGITPTNADSMVCFGVGNPTDDTLSVTNLAAATLGTLEPELWQRLSTGGLDCYAIFTAKLSPGGPTATGNFTWTQTDSVTKSLAFAIRPEPSVNINSSVTDVSPAATDSSTATHIGLVSATVTDNSPASTDVVTSTHAAPVINAAVTDSNKAATDSSTVTHTAPTINAAVTDNSPAATDSSITSQSLTINAAVVDISPAAVDNSTTTHLSPTIDAAVTDSNKAATDNSTVDHVDISAGVAIVTDVNAAALESVTVNHVEFVIVDHQWDGKIIPTLNSTIAYHVQTGVGYRVIKIIRYNPKPPKTYKYACHVLNIVNNKPGKADVWYDELTLSWKCGEYNPVTFRDLAGVTKNM